MIPPKHSKAPLETKASRRKANYTTVISTVRRKEGIKEPASYMRAPANDALTLKPATAWIDCKQDREEVARILKGGAK